MPLNCSHLSVDINYNVAFMFSHFTIGTYRGIAFTMNIILFNESAAQNLLMAKLHFLNGFWIQPFQLYQTWLRGQIGPFLFLIYMTCFYCLNWIMLILWDFWFIFFFIIIMMWSLSRTRSYWVKKYINLRLGLKNYFLLSAKRLIGTQYKI